MLWRKNKKPKQTTIEPEIKLDKDNPKESKPAAAEITVPTTTSRNPGWLDLPTIYASLKQSSEAITSELQPFARNWEPLLDPLKELIIDITKEFEGMADEDKVDPSWKNFSNQALEAIEKLKPIIQELKKGKINIPLITKHLSVLVSTLPALINKFNKLQLDIKVHDMILNVKDLQQNFTTNLQAEIQRILPSYDKIKVDIETRILELENPETQDKFSKLSATEKSSALIAIGNFNRVFEEIFLALNRVSIQMGIKEEFLLSKPIFLNGKYNLKEMYEKYNDFYSKSLVTAGFPALRQSSRYQYLEKIILQENNFLAKHEEKISLNKNITNKQERTINSLRDLIQMEINKLQSAGKKQRTQILRQILENLNQNAKNGYPFEDILEKSLKSLPKNDFDRVEKKNNVMLKKIKNQHEEAVNAIKNMQEKHEIDKAYLQKRIKKSEQQLSEARLNSTEPEIKSVETRSPPSDNLKRTGVIVKDLLQQAKEGRDLLSNRIKGNKAAAPSPVKSIEKALKYLDGQLKTMLDENIYRQFIQLDTNKNNFVLLKGTDWIKQTGLSLAKIQQLLAQYKEITAYLKAKKLGDVNNEIKSPEEHLLRLGEKTVDITKTSKQLLSHYLELEKNPFIKQLLSAGGFQEIFLPGSSNAKQQSINPEKKSTASENNAHENTNMQINSLEVIMNTAKRFYQKTAQNHLQDDTQTAATLDALGNVQNFLRDLLQLRKNNKDNVQISKSEIFAFLMNHMKDIAKILQDLPNTYRSMRSVSEKEFSTGIRNLNLALRDLVLLFNRIETELYLKPGYFTQNSLQSLFSTEIQDLLKMDKLPLGELGGKSLNDLINSSYINLDKLNYSISAEEKYPFLSAILEQQEQMYKKTGKNNLKKSFITYLMNQNIIQIAENLMAESENNKTQINTFATVLNNLINEKIQTLKAEKNANNEIKQKLLNQLLQNGNGIEKLDTQLDNIAANEQDRRHIHLLYASQTKKLLESLRETTISRNDILNEIEVKISQLTEKRQKQYYFFVKEKRTAIEDTLHAFSELKKFLAHPGHHAKSFAIENPKLYQTLLKFDKDFLQKLHNMSRHSFYLSHEKKIVGDVSEPENLVINHEKIAFIEAHQSQLIAARIKELQPTTFFQTKNQTKTIILLQALNQHLQTKPLARALDAIRQDKVLGTDFYLLHAGKTGEMIKKFNQLHLSKKDIMHKIDIELTRLRAQRGESSLFSNQSNKLTLENRIQACITLREQIREKAADKSSEFFSITEIVNTLPPKDRKILAKYESKLLNELKLWESENYQLSQPKKGFRL